MNAIPTYLRYKIVLLNLKFWLHCFVFDSRCKSKVVSNTKMIKSKCFAQTISRLKSRKKRENFKTLLKNSWNFEFTQKPGNSLKQKKFSLAQIASSLVVMGSYRTHCELCIQALSKQIFRLISKSAGMEASEKVLIDYLFTLMARTENRPTWNTTVVDIGLVVLVILFLR